MAPPQNRIVGDVSNHGVSFVQSAFYGSVHLGNSENQKCLRDLNATNPRDDKARRLLDKDPLLQGSYSWVIEDPAFQTWWNEDESHILWIHGDPGKGKTMIMMGMIEELELRLSREPHSAAMAYFFCQDGVSGLNNAVSILKGLIFFIATMREDSSQYLQQRYNQKGPELFNDINAFVALQDILTYMVNDLDVPRVYLLIDALDECRIGIQELLVLMENREGCSKIKWLVTSRNYTSIREHLEYSNFTAHTSLEINSAHVSNTVQAFINSKVNELSRIKGYSILLSTTLKEYLRENSEDTFLWVSLVCKELRKIPAINVKKVMYRFPPGLDPLYDRMLASVQENYSGDDVASALRLLQVVTTSFVPREAGELAMICRFDDAEFTTQFIKEFCASFLIIRKQTIYFVHQSARDYFQRGRGLVVFPSGLRDAHLYMAHHCLDSMRNHLEKDICSLKRPGTLTEEIEEAIIQNCIPAYLRYACKHWVGHLVQAISTGESIPIETAEITHFFRFRLLIWLEALSLLRGLSEGIHALSELHKLSQHYTDFKDLYQTIYDGWRFAMNNRYVLEKAPLQIYSSALCFSPESSVTRLNYLKSIPAYLKVVPHIDEDWDPCLQVIEVHEAYSSPIDFVLFSQDGVQIASASLEGPVQVWDAMTGQLQLKLKTSGTITSLRFTPDSAKIVIASRDREIVLAEVCDMKTGGRQTNSLVSASPRPLDKLSSDGLKIAVEKKYEGLQVFDTMPGRLQLTIPRDSQITIPYYLNAVVLSEDGTKVGISSETTFSIWDITADQPQLLFDRLTTFMAPAAFSPDEEKIAIGCDSNLEVVDAITGQLRSTFQCQERPYKWLIFSSNGSKIAFETLHAGIEVLDTAKSQSHLIHHPSYDKSATFSPDGTKIACGWYDGTIRIWDATTGLLCSILQGHLEWVKSIVFSPDGTKIASKSTDKTVRIWDVVKRGQSNLKSQVHAQHVNSILFSPTGTKIASRSGDTMVQIHSTATGQLQTRIQANASVTSLAFSLDDAKIAFGSLEHGEVRIHDAESAELMKILPGQVAIYSLAFSPDGLQIASGSWDDERVQVYDIITGQLVTIIKGLEIVNSLVFSPDGTKIASGSSESEIVRVWDALNGSLLRTLDGYDGSEISFLNDSSSIVWMNHSCLDFHHEAEGTPTHVARGSFGQDHWIFKNGSRLMWLPLSVRPGAFATRGNTIALASRSGRMTILQFQDT